MLQFYFTRFKYT